MTGAPLRRRLIAAALASTVALGAAELTCRIALPPLGSVDLPRHPMHDWAVVDGFAAYRARPGRYGRLGKTVNREGMMSTPELTPGPAADGVLRIAFLGGSSTACTVPPLPDERTWPSLVGRDLEARTGRRIEVINAALPGYSTFESFGRLWARLRFFRPDVVVVYHGWNDLYWFGDVDALPRWRRGGDAGWTFDAPYRLDESRPHPFDDVIGWSDLLRRVSRTLWPAPRNGEFGPVPARLATDWDPRAPGIFEENLRLIRELGEVMGAEVHLAKQATLIVPDLAPALQERCRYGLHGFDHAAHVRAYAALHAAVDRVGPADRVIDCTSLSGDPRWLVDHVHLSDAGGEQLARLVTDHLAAHSARLAAPAAPPSGR